MPLHNSEVVEGSDETEVTEKYDDPFIVLTYSISSVSYTHLTLPTKRIV